MTVEINTLNTLRYDEELCSGCGMCILVCPHRVFAMQDRKARLVRWETCIECGACELNCPTGAIAVDSGVGCAAAMIRAALTGGEPTCGDDACCGPVGQNTETCCGPEITASGKSVSCCGSGAPESAVSETNCCGVAKEGSADCCQSAGRGAACCEGQSTTTCCG